MAAQNANVSVPNGFVSWEEVVGETIKLATSSLGIAAGLVGIVAAPVAVTLIDKAIDAYKEHVAREEFKAEERAFATAEAKAAQHAFEAAEAAAEKGNAEKAAGLLGDAAAEGSPKAMYALAMSLLKEEEAYRDYRKIEKALRCASDAGIDDATLQLALLLYQNATTWDRASIPWKEHPNRPEYIKLVKKLVDIDPQIHMQAANLYGFELVTDGKFDELEQLIEDVMVPASLSDIFELYTSAKKSPLDAARLLYISTYTDLPDKEKVKRLKACSKKGYTPAMNNLAMMYKESDPDECRRLLVEAARTGYHVALGNLVATDRERFGDEGAINRYIAAVEKRDEIGVRALCRMCGSSNADALELIKKFWDKGDELRVRIMRKGEPDAMVGIEALGGATAAIVGTCARDASARKKPFAEFLTARAEDLGYLKPLKEQTYTVLEEVASGKSGNNDPFAGVGRNDPCPCGSGKKFKNCHGLTRKA